MMTRALLCLMLAIGIGRSCAETAVPPHRTYGPWRSGKIQGGGYLQHVVFCHSDSKRMYMTSDVGGAFRSDDGGQTWRMIHAGLPADGKSYEIRGLVADPKDADRIHLCTNQGVYLSVDGGIRWKQVLDAAFWGNGWYRGEGRVLVRDPDNPALLYAASIGDGVFRSSDAGESWIKLGPEKVMPSDLCIDRSSPKRLWLCARPYKDWKWKEAKVELKSGLYRSLDGGNSWELLSESTPSEIVQDPHDAGILWGH